jgi:hypothetical protein
MAKCSDRGQGAFKEAWAIVPWGEGVRLRLWFSQSRIELPNHEWSDELEWKGGIVESVVTAEGAFPFDLIRIGLYSFDGFHVSKTAEPPSMIRRSTDITLPRPFRVGNVEFQGCVYRFLDTDFGKRKDFSCSQIGTIAEEEDLSSGTVPADWAPSSRIVTAEKVPGTYPQFPLKTVPPYRDELLAEVKRFSKDRNFVSPCRTRFENFIQVQSP